jgi:hypothetical protein
MANVPKLSPIGDATSGAIGAVIANTLIFPLDVIKTRLQVQNESLKLINPSNHYDSALDAFRKIFVEEGLLGLYAGLVTGLAGTVVSSFSYFYIYSTIRGKYTEYIDGEDISTTMELALGAGAGALCQFIVLPIGVVTTRFSNLIIRQQTDPELKRKPFYHVMKLIIEEEGLQGLWKGFQASLVLCSNPAITYGLFNRVKSVILNSRQGELTSGQIFFIGAFSKALATVVTCISLNLY